MNKIFYKPRHPDCHQQQRAFTLVELSIVLVILGLLVGGVLTGQSLIRAAELRSVTTQYNQYIAAVHTFRDKYFALPGDMTNAQSFWGIAHATPATCATTVGTGTQTCNGNGDGQVSWSSSGNEPFRFWQHLANAGLLEGSYSGVAGAGGSLHATTTNSPRSKIGTGLWFAFNYQTQSSAGDVFDGVYNNILELGAPTTAAHPYNPLVKPEEIWNIDVKIDDGKPAAGKLVIRMTNGVAACTTATLSTTLTGDYALSTNAANCGFIFRQVY